MEANDDELLTNFGATRCSIWGLELVRTGRRWAPLGTAGHRWAPLGTFVLILQPCSILTFIAREHGLFGAHESEDIRTI